MPQIITWNKDDEVTTLSEKILADGEETSLSQVEFEARYLGSYEEEPTLDNDGEALATNALYTDNDNLMHRWTGSEWKQITTDAEVETTEPHRDVAIYCYPDDHTITVGTNFTIISNAEGEEILHINDVNSSNSHLHNVDDTPDTFYPYKWRYTEEDGWSEQLGSWIDPALFDEGGE